MSSPPFFRASQNLPVARSFQRPVAIPKAPIVNPYEKFTQPQFDTWIGDITGALRDALGFQAELPPKPKARTHWHIPPSEGSEAPVASEEDEDADCGDGRLGRDPREGPGLGKGDRGAPIEIDLDSEEEQEEEEEEEEEWEEEEEGFRTSDEEEEEEAIRNGESSARAHARYKKYAGAEINPEAIEVISDDEDTNELQPEDGEVSGEEYSDGENANPTSLLIGHGHAVERDYSDQGEETGSESENEAASSPPRAADDSNVYEDIFGEEDDELDDDEAEEEEAGPEDDPRADEDLVLEEDQDEQVKEDDIYAPFDISAQNYYGDDVLPGSSPILSSPIEPEHAFQVFEVDEPEEDVHQTRNELETFDWNNPPAFPHGIPASAPGHLATPVEDDIDEYPQSETFGTSDQLPIFESESAPMQFDEGAEDIDSVPAPEYFVTEAEELSIDPQHFTVEESFTDHEPDERGMSLDVLRWTRRWLPEMSTSWWRASRGWMMLKKLCPSQQRNLREEQVDGQIPVDEPVQQNGSKGSTILMPVSADPTVHDPFGSRQTTPPLSMVDATPVSIPLPASVLKAIRPDSGLFTPPSGAISAVDSAATTPHSVDDLFPADTEIPKGEHVDLGSAVELVHGEENMAVFANGGGDAEEGMVDATSLQDEATAVAPELDVAALSSVEMEEDPVAIDRSQTNGTDFTADFTQPEHILTAYPSEVTLAASATPVLEFDPYPYSLSTPGERPDPVEQEEISPSSTGDKDSEEKTEGDDGDICSHFS
ncbi:hypothetical protein B0H14DRAFT_3474031 [Mycena olivaceomarginata]|nr:hypothetical protein B0H14DRAFT_3474031 [Mycena olivaceomarginata]